MIYMYLFIGLAVLAAVLSRASGEEMTKLLTIKSFLLIILLWPVSSVVVLLLLEDKDD